MPRISPEFGILISSVGCLIVALSLSGGSLAKEVKWNLYNTKTDYCVAGGQLFDLYAYQTLWTSFDGFEVDPSKYQVAYQPVKNDGWRKLARILILLTIGIGAVSLVTLLCLSLVPYLKKNTIVINTGRIVSSVMSFANGVFLAYTLRYYHEQYPTLKSATFLDPRACYPDEDNPSTGFYMASTACVLFFISAILNIVNAAKLVHDNRKKLAVAPMKTDGDKTSLQSD